MSQHLRKAWDRVKKSEELQELLKDPQQIESMIRKSEFLRGASWFDLAKLLSGKNSEGAYIAQKLLDGAYRTINRSNRPGANVGASSFDLNRDYERVEY
jgi:hypothetical protein